MARRPKTPPAEALGFRRNPNRSYTNLATGETIGRRDYDRLFGRFKGTDIRSNEQLARERPDLDAIARQARYETIREDFRRQVRLETDELISVAEARRDERLKQIIRDLRTASNEPGSRKARALEALGRRVPGANYKVGDTPAFHGERVGGLPMWNAREGSLEAAYG